MASPELQVYEFGPFRLDVTERELCCDDLALQGGADPSFYARTLLDMEALRAAPESLALAANAGDLRQRIRRLLVPAQPHAETFPRWMAAAFGLVSVLALVANLVVLQTLVHLGVGKIPAQAIAIVLVTPVNFVGNKLWTFRMR